MIVGDRSKDGTLISELSEYSRKLITKRCDICKKEYDVTYQDLIISRKRRNSQEDRCFKCAMEKQSGSNNPAKRDDVRKKISKATKGKSKTFKDDENLRLLKRKLTTAGYIQTYNEDKKTYELEHRRKISEHIGRELLDSEKVHHINGNKADNSISNLILCENESDHQSLHQQYIGILFELMNAGIVKFNKRDRKYYIDSSIHQNSFPRSLGFEDVAILQNKNVCRSRLDTDISSEVIRGIRIDIPMIASNMSSVTNAEFCIELYKLGALGVMHRALPDSILVKEVSKIAEFCDVVCASVGIGDEQIELCKKVVNAGANVIFVDVAHGYSDFVIDMGKRIKNEFGVKVVLGNTINTDMMYEVYEFVDAIKVGIANGLSCKTKNTASCNEKQFSSIYKFKELSREFGIPIIGDGGVREPADFVKAIAAGASSIMSGSIFARCPESAASVVDVEGHRKKIYSGMASREVQNEWKNGVKKGTCTEGKVRYLDIGEPVIDLINRYAGALRSGMTYAGSKNVVELQDFARFVRV